MNSGEVHLSMDYVFVFTEWVLQAEPTATLPKPNLGELTRQLARLDLAPCHLPGRGTSRWQLKKFPRGKNESIYHYQSNSRRRWR